MKVNVELGFASLEQEVENILLPVEGKVPAWLSGTLIRNGAAKFEVGAEKYNHWFDGLAMLHKFAFRKGQILYTNKFLKGNTFNTTTKKGKIVYPEFATIPKSSLLYRIFLNVTGQFTDNASVNVTRLGDSYIALTETPPRVEFDPDSLRTLGQFKYEDQVTGHLTTVHPQFDFQTEQIINYITRFSLTSTYNIYSIQAGSSKRSIISSIPVKQPAYMHSFGMTENYIILTEFPLFINHFKLLLTGSAFVDNLFWQPDHGTTFLVIDKTSGKLVGKFNCEPFIAFHHINCYEEEGNIIVDVASYEDSSIIKSLYLDKLRQGDFLLPTPQIQRYYLELSNNRVTTKILTEDFIEFPRINYRRYNTKVYNFVYGLSDQNSNGFTNKLAKFCIKSKSFRYWYQDNNFPGEPVFVAAPGAVAEDEGIVFSLVLDTIKRKTYLLILDAISFSEIARAYLPFAVPFGSHGQYFE